MHHTHLGVDGLEVCEFSAAPLVHRRRCHLVRHAKIVVSTRITTTFHHSPHQPGALQELELAREGQLHMCHSVLCGTSTTFICWNAANWPAAAEYWYICGK